MLHFVLALSLLPLTFAEFYSILQKGIYICKCRRIGIYNINIRIENRNLSSIDTKNMPLHSNLFPKKTLFSRNNPEFTLPHLLPVLLYACSIIFSLHFILQQSNLPKQTASRPRLPRDFHPRVVLTRPYLLPATLLTLGLIAIGEYHYPVCTSSPISCRNLAYSTSNVSPAPFTLIHTLTQQKILAHSRSGSIQTLCIHFGLILPRRYLTGFLCQGTFLRVHLTYTCLPVTDAGNCGHSMLHSIFHSYKRKISITQEYILSQVYNFYNDIRL